MEESECYYCRADWKNDPSKNISILISGSCQYYLIRPKKKKKIKNESVFAEGIEFGMLRWGIYPGLSRRSLNDMPSVLKGQRHREIMEQKTMWIQKQRKCNYTSRKAGSHQKLEETKTDSPLQPPQGVWPCQNLDFCPVILTLDFRPPEMWGN